MIILILGLVLFLGPHSVRIFAEDWRARRIAGLGALKWKGLYSIVSGVGLVLIIYGYGLARAQPVVLWAPPVWARHLAGLLTLVAFILLVAAYVPRNHIKARIGHPMLLAVKVWAFAHLLANGTLNALVLFGAFFAWAVIDFIVARRRDRAAGTVYPPGTPARDVVTVAVGIVAWAVFAFALHAWWIGVSPFG
jgi:uncharacterized membrane protein